MGQQQSNIKDDIKNKYTIIKTISSGQYLVKPIKKQTQLQLRILNFLIQDQMIHYIQLLQKRKKIINPHLLQIIQYSKVIDQLMCSSTFKLKIICQLPFKSIKDDINERSKCNPKKYFTQDQLWSILYSCSHALYSLYINKFSHQSLTTQHIYINTDGIIKISDCLLVNNNKNYLHLMNQSITIDNIRYISPQLRNLVDQNHFYQYQKQKSDVFILAMIILEISTLNIIEYYNISNKKFQFDVIQSSFNQFKIRYSNKIQEILQKMLLFDYNIRPTFEQIIQNIQDKTIHTHSNNSSKESTIINQVREYSSKSSAPPIFNNFNDIKQKLNFDIPKSNNYTLPQSFNFSNYQNYPPPPPPPPPQPNYNITNNPQTNLFSSFGHYNISEGLKFENKQSFFKPFDSKIDTVTKNKKQIDHNYTPYQQLMNLSGNATTIPSVNPGITRESIPKPLHNFNNIYIPQQTIYPTNQNIPKQNGMKERRFSQLKFGAIQVGRATEKKQTNLIEKQFSFTETKRSNLFKKQKVEEETAGEQGTFVIYQNDNNRYQGFIQDNQKNGIGRMIYSDGGMYQGQWKYDLMDGYGKLYFSNGKLAYQGHWIEDKFHGTGRIYENIQQNEYINSINYLDFSNIKNKWISYQGQFQNDLKNGKGMIKFITGQKFYGHFKEDNIEGQGTFYKKDGNIIHGFWQNNEFIQN